MRRKLDRAEVVMLKQDLESFLALRMWEPDGKLLIEETTTRKRFNPRPLLAFFGYLTLAKTNAIVFENTDTKHYEYGQGTDLEPVATELLV